MRELKFRGWHKVAKVMSAGATLQFLYNKNGAYDDAHIDFMQFTGLHDNDGKDIYEGDIVRYFLDGEICINKVAWCEDRDFNGWEFTAQNEEDGIEVIGNIYENNDLL